MLFSNLYIKLLALFVFLTSFIGYGAFNFLGFPSQSPHVSSPAVDAGYAPKLPELYPDDWDDYVVIDPVIEPEDLEPTSAPSWAVPTTAPIREDENVEPTTTTAPTVESDKVEPTTTTTPVVEDENVEPTTTTSPVVEDENVEPTTTTATVVESDKVEPTSTTSPVVEDENVEPTTTTAPAVESDKVEPTSTTSPVVEDENVEPTTTTTPEPSWAVPTTAPIREDENVEPTATSTPEAEETTAPTTHPVPQDEQVTRWDKDYTNRYANTGEYFPGSKIYALEGRHFCSGAFVVEREGRRYLMTAGHCDPKKEENWKKHEWFMIGPNHTKLVLGKTALSNTENTADYMLIDITDVKDVKFTNQLPELGPIVGTMKAEEIKAGDEICHIGATTGLSCGDPEAYSKEDGIILGHAVAGGGDSGGATFVIRDGEVYAVGVLTGILGKSNLITYRALDKILEQENLTFVN